ncbi:MAG TPA: DinB family protein, partial [Bryobacteraceae bacterium]|nr:DinB family protein [Bryobacteraceae bacterium]
DAVRDFPVERAGIRPAGSPHSAWELLEHLRIAQHDILCFSMGPEKYVELKWPDDYWPSSAGPSSAAEWGKSVAAVRRDLDSFIRLLRASERDLFEPFSWGTGQTLLREALLIADHNAYHLGQLVLIHRMLGKTAGRKN